MDDLDDFFGKNDLTKILEHEEEAIEHQTSKEDIEKAKQSSKKRKRPSELQETKEASKKQKLNLPSEFKTPFPQAARRSKGTN